MEEKEWNKTGAPVLKSDGDIGFLGDYNNELFPSDPTVGFYIHNDKLFMITTLQDQNNIEDVRLVLRSVDLEGKVEDVVLMENVKFLQPFIAYRSDICYFSCVGSEEGAYFGQIRLGEDEPDIIETFPLVENNKQTVSGKMITMMTMGKNGLIYQLSEYENGNINSDAPKSNQLILREGSETRILLGELDNIDTLVEMDGVILTHERMYGQPHTKITFYDSNFRVITESQDHLLNEFWGAKKLTYNEEDFVLYREVGSALLLTHVETGQTIDCSHFIGKGITSITLLGDYMV